MLRNKCVSSGRFQNEYLKLLFQEIKLPFIIAIISLPTSVWIEASALVISVHDRERFFLVL